jgi:hypothetical protein
MSALVSQLALVGSLAASLAQAYTVPLSSVDVSEQVRRSRRLLQISCCGELVTDELSLA